MNAAIAINHRARSSEQKALRRHAVLETAEIYFKEVGYEAFSMGQLAKASRTYWTIMAAIFFLSLGLGGLMIHFVPILLDVGFTASAAVKIAGVIGIAVVLGRLLVGFAVDRIFAPRVAIAILIACISGVLALAFLGTAAAVPAAFVIGFSVGAEVDLMGYLVARYFGIQAYGQIYGRQYSTFLIATGLSPVILGAVRDATGSYTASLWTAAAFMVISAACLQSSQNFNRSLVMCIEVLCKHLRWKCPTDLPQPVKREVVEITPWN